MSVIRMESSSRGAFAMTLVACGAVETPPIAATSSVEQASVKKQGMQMQGMQMQGMNLGSVTLSGDTLRQVRVVRGELVAMRGSNTVRGTQLIDAHRVTAVACLLRS